MEKKTLFRDRQEVGPDDLDGMQDSIRTSIDHIVGDGISTEMRFTGFQVTKESSTSLRIGIGRLYKDGKVFNAEDEIVMSVQNKLPVANRIILSVYVFGQEVETDVQERNFVTDISVFPPNAEPQAVPMQYIRNAQVNILAGIESVDPLAPALPSNALLVATVMLSTTGVVDGGIARAIFNILPNVQDHEYRLLELAVWRLQNGAKVDALTSEQAALNARTLNKAEMSVVTSLLVDVAKIKRIANLPTATAPYDTDIFSDNEQIDQALSAVGTSYRLSAFGGADFPFAAFAEGPLALFNPYDAGVYRSGTNLVLPKFEPVVAIETSGYSGEVNIGQLSVSTIETKLMTGTKTETRYGYA